MKKITRFFMLIGIISMAVSCQKKDFTWVESSVPEGVDVKMLDAWSSVVPIEVKSNGEWVTELTNDDWFYLSQENGKGNAIIRLYVLDNRTEQRKNGTIKIVTKDGTSSTIEIQQKSIADYDDNAVLDTRGDIRYAVGYGFNALKGEYPSVNTITMQILRMDTLNSAKKVEFNASKAEFEEKTVTGSSFEELSNKLNAAASIKGSGFGFSGEVNANFTMDNYKSGLHEFAINYIHYEMGTIAINSLAADLLENFINPVAQRAIDGNSTRPAYKKYRGKEGAKKMVQELGTHLIIKAKMGGELRYKMAVDISKVTGAYDLHAFAKAAYAGANISTDASITDDLKTSFTNNSKNYALNFVAYGGNPALLIEKSAEITVQGKNNWVKSLNAGENFNLSFLGVEMRNADDTEYLIPIQDLVSIEKETEYVVRVKEIEDAIAELKTVGGSSYVNSTEVKIQIPNFSIVSNDPEYPPTLIKEVKIGGEVKAWICNEFIPLLNSENRVTVIYPVIENKPRFNLGYFIGDEFHKPARVSWTGNKVYIREYNHNAFGANGTVYIIGASVNSTQTTDKVFDGTIADKKMYGPTNAYPLVKIFGNVWTKQNYKDPGSDGLDVIGDLWWSNHYLVGHCYKMNTITRSGFAPSGWRVATSTDFSGIKEGLILWKIQQIGNQCRQDGLLGFEVPVVSGSNIIYWYYRDASQNTGGKHNEYMTVDGSHVRITDQGVFVVEPLWEASSYHMPIRLVMNLD